MGKCGYESEVGVGVLFLVLILFAGMWVFAAMSEIIMSHHSIEGVHGLACKNIKQNPEGVIKCKGINNREYYVWVEVDREPFNDRFEERTPFDGRFE